MNSINIRELIINTLYANNCIVYEDKETGIITTQTESKDIWDFTIPMKIIDGEQIAIEEERKGG